MKRVFPAVLALTVALTALDSSQPGQARPSAPKPAVLGVSSFGAKLRLESVLARLESYSGKTPYVFSGSTPAGWDCSGLVAWTYKQLLINLPHSANKQAHLGKRVSDPQAGDIVAFAYPGSITFYHSAIYVGGGKIINANRYWGKTLIQPLSAPDFKNSQVRFIRITIK